MSERKRYTAEEIRKVADQPAYCGDDCEVHFQPELVPMLRQAADAEEELEALKDERDNWKFAKERVEREMAGFIKERDELKSRLDAVVKECEHFESMIARHGTLYQAEASNIHNAILRAARGEGGAE